MTRPESDGIYAQACLSRRIVPQKEEGSQWYKALAMFETRDVEAALDGWWRSSDRDSGGELKSKWLPAPGELVPLVMAVLRQRTARDQEHSEGVVWKCPVCGAGRSGFPLHGDPLRRNCQNNGKDGRCGALMEVMYRGKFGNDRELAA